MGESAIQTKIIRYLEKTGWFVLKLIQTNKNGIPDLYAYRARRTVFFECKVPGEIPEPLQDYRIAELQAAGIEAYPVCSLSDVKNIVDAA